MLFLGLPGTSAGARVLKQGNDDGDDGDDYNHDYDTRQHDVEQLLMRLTTGHRG